MIAKIISHGATRDEARGKLICGLEQVEAFGVTTNQGFLIACLRHPAFAKGEATTAFIGNHRDELLAPRADEATDGCAGGAAALCQQSHAPPWRAGRSLAATFPLAARFTIGGKLHEIEIVRERDGGYVASRNGDTHRFEIEELAGDAIRFRHDGVMQSAKFLRDDDRLFFLHRGVTLTVHDLTLAAPESAAASGGDGKVRAAMNGRVVARAGQARRQGCRRPARDDAGGDEDGARAHGRRRRHGVVHRRRRGRAGHDGEDRRRDRGRKQAA